MLARDPRHPGLMPVLHSAHESDRGAPLRDIILRAWPAYSLHAVSSTGDRHPLTRVICGELQSAAGDTVVITGRSYLDDNGYEMITFPDSGYTYGKRMQNRVARSLTDRRLTELDRGTTQTTLISSCSG